MATRACWRYYPACYDRSAVAKSRQKDKKDLRKAIGLYFISLACALLTVLFLPMLWTYPVHSFLQLFSPCPFDRWNKDVCWLAHIFSHQFTLVTPADLIGVTTPLIYLLHPDWSSRLAAQNDPSAFNFWTTSAELTTSSAWRYWLGLFTASINITRPL
jgi:hypothetical protein